MTPGALARRFITLLGDGAPAEAIAPLLHPDIEQTEYPNALMPRGQTRGREGMLAGVELGRALLAEQRYDIARVIEAGPTVVVEMSWHATLATPAGPLPAGARLTCHICAVIEVRGGQIWRQRNYDCYAPFGAEEPAR